MNRIVEEKIKNEHYHSSAAMVWCFDARFSNALSSVVKHDNLHYADIVKVAGGAKDIASPEREEARNYILDQLEKSFKLHKPDAIYLMVHAGCGAYGKTFSDAESEKEFYLKELDRAEEIVKNFLKEKNIEIKIIKCYADFDGVLA